MLFADADSAYNDADYVIFGAPFDGTSSFRSGSASAPQAIRNESYNFETYNPNLDVDLTELKIHDAGDIEAGEKISTTLSRVASATRNYVTRNKTPIMLGGEHSLTIAAARECTPEWIIILDAHLDLRDEYEGEKHSHACTTRRLYEEVTKNIIEIGIRSGTREEYTFVKRNKIHCYNADQIFKNGIKSVLNKIKEHIGDETIYLSLDIDAIDPCYAPGVGTPEPFGMTPRDTREIIWTLAPTCVGFDVVEIVPDLDINTASLGAKLTREFIAAKRKHQQT
ncbi:agmatinase [Methanosarcinales archaeon ex4572_44]|nr:MAG: agmatinase [Methanosarcinales archaeon ex4484_138]PHP45442.1 MAG: agmatinase [Methanosarcinales archaeon ex4572_44]